MDAVKELGAHGEAPTCLSKGAEDDRSSRCWLEQQKQVHLHLGEECNRLTDAEWRTERR